MNFPCLILIGYCTVLCTIWKDIVRVCIVLKTCIGVESNTGFQYNTDEYNISILYIALYNDLWPKKKKMCVYCHMSTKSRVGRSGLIFFSFFSFLLSAKPEIVVPGSGIQFRYFIFEISGKPSFIEAVL